MHTHPRPTHAHTPTSHWIPSLSSSSIPFLHPMPPPDSGDPRGSPPPSSPPRGHLSPLTISTDRLLSSPRRATPRHWWWCAARRPQQRRAAVAAGTATSAWSGWSQPFKIHQPPQARPPRRLHRGQGEPHPDQLLDAVHWIRQAVGLACGLLWGAVPLVGAFWIALVTWKY
ncbi:uncharacterized protein LOC119330896 isoform X3 [Triticum dicoccoides]|uniref:uncharacterized protein LOC119330896 isoform X3 n=1 Tax=Triticum dicoccoides TaxID=85692 RepID=UPI00188EA580|nr:uncharacterized protein LOC119330896 isoform X3 [Triticum dicoccoides]